MELLIVVVLLAVILAIVAVVSRAMRKRDPGSGADIVPYLVLALAMGVSGFALASLARTAFPGDRLVFDPAEEVSVAIASLVVALPFVIYFWRRQADRRAQHPHPAGWTVYLTLMELVFTTAFVTSAVFTVNGWMGEGGDSSWPATLIFGAIVVFHELAARRSPPGAESGELPRVVGAAIGLVTFWIGASGALTALFGTLFPSLDLEFHPWVAMAVVGAAVWAYHWFTAWPDGQSIPRTVWSTLVTILAATIAVGSVTSLLVLSLQYLFTDTPPAGQHFEAAPLAIGLFFVSLPLWAVHRRVIQPAASGAHQFYMYAAATIGLLWGVGAAVALTVITLDRSLLVGGSAADIVSAATIAVVGVPIVWVGFSRRAHRVAEPATPAWPRRLYLLGVGIVFGVAAAVGLISALLILLQRVLQGGEPGSVLTPITVFLYAGAVAWYLLAQYARERGRSDLGPAGLPFDVTVITSHPGMLATRFPDNARLKVVHRGDDVGMVDDEMAEEIVAAVNGQPSLVWVDEDGFRVAPIRSGA